MTDYAGHAPDPATPEVGLPTEIWREVVERRQRYFEIRKKIENGEIREINNFITYNLNITQFAQDAVEFYEGSDFINAFYKAIKDITILDPTCGSGAFLFAALNILEPLYESCIKRMREFVEIDNETGTGKKHKNFRQVLEDIEKHPNEKYYIYKTIILNNLYGVDIMKEAVEIAKLRLFLKLVAEVEPDKNDDNYGLEPLPDIDFNIRSGNTLVGCATKVELDKGLKWSFDFEKDSSMIHEKMDVVARAFKRYKEIQLEHSQDDFTAFKKAKDKLLKRLKELNDILNGYLAKDYAIINDKPKYEKWLFTHKPFHWFAEFYEIIHQKNGFDVIIGNPPYIEYSKKFMETYSIQNLKTLNCGNLHAFIVEKSSHLIHNYGRKGFIVPLPSINTARMQTLQEILKSNNTANYSLWISSYDERPSSLFSGVDQRLIIEIFGSWNDNPELYTSGIYRWYSNTRELLFQNIHFNFNQQDILHRTKSILKIKNASIEQQILNKFYKNGIFFNYVSDIPTINSIYYRTAGGRYWKVIQVEESESKNLSEKVAYLKGIDSYQAAAVLSSSTFWWYYSVHYDMYNLKDYMLFGFRFSNPKKSTLTQLKKIGECFIESLDDNSFFNTINSKTRGKVIQKLYVVAKSKYISDEIDKVLAEHYGFTEEELDFIINYDIKYRMGKELNNGE